MTTEEAIVHFFEKKTKNELSKSEIKMQLESDHGFTASEIKSIFTEISNRELLAIQK